MSLLLAAPASAQVSIGLAGGAALFDISVSDDDRADAALAGKLEPVSGAVLAIDVSESIHIAPEFLVTVKGTRLPDDFWSDGQLRPWDFNLTYLEVPVLARYRPGARWLHLLGGPYVAWLLETQLEARDGGSDPDYDRAFKTFDFGWVAGIGAGGDHARVDFRYSNALTDLDGDGSFATLFTRDQGVRLRNRGFSVVGSLLF